MRPPSRLDPQGYYARLGVDPASAQEVITHAFRRKALVLHPDVPKTGDKEAFVALRAAYDVLSDPGRRRAYDESARKPERSVPASAPAVSPVAHGMHDFRPNVADAPWMTEDAGHVAPGFTPRPSAPVKERDRFPVMQVLLGVGVAGALCVGVVGTILSLRSVPSGVSAGITPTAPPVAPQPEGMSRLAQYGPLPVRLAGVPNYYVLPTASATILWRQESDRLQVAPLGQLPAFSSVQALRFNKQSGLVEVRFDETSTAFVDARSLTPGDAAAARRAWCGYNAGPVPFDGEVLERHGQGSGTMHIENRAVQPAVVKMRDRQGAVALSVYLAPNGASDLTGIPAGPLQADVAVGELWSRACNSFAAGMRARRISATLATNGATLALPPDDSVASDISDQTFEQE